MTGIDWRAVFVPDTPALEIIVRGSVMYLALFALLRFVLRREAGSIGVADLLVIVLIADAAQNGMAAGYSSIADGILLVATIVFWAYALNWLGYHFPAVQRLIHPPPLPLVRNGQMLRRNMRRELITEDELLSQLRLQGGQDLADVEFAAMEGDGRISVVMREDKRGANQAPERSV